MVIVASDTTLILFLLYFAILKLLWGIRIKRIKMMSIEQLSLDNRLELVLMPCLEGPAEICDTVPDFFFFFHKKWITEVSKYFRQNPAFTSLVRRKYFWCFILFIRMTIHFMDLNTKRITKMKETFLLSRSSEEHNYYIKLNQTIFSGLEY